VRTDWRGKVVDGCLKTPTNNLPPPVSSHSSCLSTDHQDSYREWRHHMLLVYNYVLLKMSTWCSKHVEENSILCINNNQCIKLVINSRYLLSATFAKCYFAAKILLSITTECCHWCQSFSFIIATRFSTLSFLCPFFLFRANRTLMSFIGALKSNIFFLYCTRRTAVSPAKP